MKDQSLWLDSVSYPDFPALSGRISVDVLVVGGGLTGITTAYLLKRAGCRVAVVEQHGIGQGDTGHTTAHVTFVTDARLSELAAKFGRTQARAFWDAGLEAMLQICRVVEEAGISCGLRQAPGYLYAATDKDAERERESLENDALLAAEFGFDVDTLAEDPLFGRPALRFANQLKFHPTEYVFALAKLIPGEGSYVFSHTSGSAVDAGRHELRTDGGVIAYDALVAATHVPIQGERGVLEAAFFQTKMAAYSSYAIEAAIECVPDSLFWDTADPYRYLRFDHTAEGCRVILGGEDHKTGQEADTAGCYERLEKWLQEWLPGARPQRRWSGQVWETADGLPYIGEVAPRQFVATGFSGNGMTLGTFSAMLIRDQIQGRHNPWADLFSPQRKAFLPGAWEYVRENVDFPVHFLSGHLGPADSGDDLPRGSGAVVRVEGKKRAVYLDADGKRTVLSPVCPHMGCLVSWNPAEKTWDCPCHGSRFLPTGELLGGPAESGLETVADQPGE
jgi:glycine/D-amino acid oxidase-like deaminating enzyme/nitrite reductase/ring-hydroxylating ferredoxin subunit